MESQRAAFEYAQLQLLQRARSAEQTMLLLLRNPLESWGEDAIWQLAMCEFAVEHIDTQLSAMQLQVAFRAACETARHPDEVPRLRGAMEIDSLAMAFAKSAPLREELHRQLEAFKRFCRSCGLGLGGFGRFRRINEVRGESLLALMRRTHLDALKWRPPGAPPAEQLAVTSKAKGRYIAEWRGETGEMMNEATGRTLSLRGTAGANRLGAKRYLKNVPEGQRPRQEHYTTIRLHLFQSDHIQRSKSLINSFSVNRCVVQWDEVTLNHLAWSVIVLIASDLREREVISCAKLGKDKDGAAKTGKNVGGAVTAAIEDYDAPVSNIDFCCSDTTSYNSSLNLPRDLGGSGAGTGGAYAHMWAWMRAHGHILFFMIWCLSHLGSNEVRAVMVAAGSCRRTSLLKKKGATNNERVLLVELLTDLHHATCTTDGCGALRAHQHILHALCICMHLHALCICRGIFLCLHLYLHTRAHCPMLWQLTTFARRRG